MNIYQKINEVRKAINYIQKDKSVSTGASGSYKAVTHDAVTALLREHLIKQGIICVPTLISSHSDPKEEGSKQFRYSATYRFDFINVDLPEEKISIAIEAHAMDNADKAPGKAISYAKKYAVLKLFEIETGEDEESRYQEVECITEGQLADIKKLLTEKDANEKKFLDWMKIPTLEAMPVSKFEQAIKALKDKKKVEKKADPVKKAENDIKALVDKKNKELESKREPGEEG